MSASTPALQQDTRELTPRFGLSLTLSILLIVGGLLAIALAAETSIAVTIILAWLLMIGGVVQAVHAFRSKGVGPILWKIVVALAYIATGLFLRMHLGIGLAALTLALIWFFIVEGVVSVVMFFSARQKGVSGWLLLDGLVTLLLGFLIWAHWPSGTLRIIGVFVGVNMLMNGMTRLMLTLAVKRAVQAGSNVNASA
ncbi:MAG TPA: DUF308 domain-containing protein [Terracidiphilus sp.]